MRINVAIGGYVCEDTSDHPKLNGYDEYGKPNNKGGMAKFIGLMDKTDRKVFEVLDQDFGVPASPETRTLLDMKPKQEPTPVGPPIQYEYRDKDGALRYIVYRQALSDGKKRIWQSLVDADGVIVKQGPKEGERLPYNCAAVVAANKLVFIVEGEKCADALIALGLIATTNSGGAEKWQPELNDYFTAKHVIVIPDNDEKGAKHAQMVAQNLHGKADKLRILTLEGLPNKGDVWDWLQIDGRMDSPKKTGQWLIDQTRALPDWKPEDLPPTFTNPPAVPVPGAAPAITFSMTPFIWEDPATLPRREWLYGKNYIRKFTNLDVAPGGLGKSSLVMVEALAMVTGRDLLGVKTAKPLRVWYHNGEDPMFEIKLRFAGAIKRFKITPDQIGDRLFTDSGRDFPITMAAIERSGAVVSEELIQLMVQDILAKQVDVLIIDPFVSTHAVPENDNNAIQAVARAWGRIANLTGCAINLVHHTRKTNGMEISVEDGRGGSALKDAARSARAFNQMTQSQAESWGVDNRRLYFRTDDGKNNLAPPSDAATWFKLESCYLGNGGLIDLGDSVGVVTTWMPPDMLAGITAADLPKVRAAISDGTYKANEGKDWAGHAIGSALGLDASNGQDKAKIKSAIKMWIASGQFVEVEDRCPERRAMKMFLRLNNPESDCTTSEL